MNENTEAAPFAAGDAPVMDTTEMMQYIGEGIAPVAVGGVAERTIDDVVNEGNRPVPIDKSLLVNQTFAIHAVQTLEDGAVNPENPRDIRDLIIGAVQLVELNDAGKVVRAGRMCVVTFGADNSVLGMEAADVQLSGNYPYFIRGGLMEKTAARGTYYTMRKRVGKDSPTVSASVWGD